MQKRHDEAAAHGGGSNGTAKARSAKYRRAALRHLIFTTGPNRLSGGRLLRRHLAQGVEVRELEIASPTWPEAFDGMRIGHISDLHVGDLLPVDRAVEIAVQLASLEPDLIACTGDVVDLDNAMAPPVLEALRAVDAPMGNLLVLGNHDHLDDGEALAAMAKAADLTVLRDESVEIIHNGGRLVLGGVEWGRTVKECSERVARLGDGVDVLLSHNPKSFLEATRRGIPLTLAGHTHGGQIARRAAPNHNLAFAHGHSRGLYCRAASHLFVTTGVGAWFPLRVNCPPEIALITMRRAR
ncbi:MAG TPA: metallophosphoesterase family protein [Phycisphaerales bacterium]|nr:metallophosphoesterase family protein [Phycisphaerales bacterium]HMP37407.1 metallophosphoesterase family protein [Phycisphaerales bacterium]